uniref:Acetyl-coenzyme A carboxylase carboxyl transferase subunit alpha n=2 Tax=Gracilariopsis TaxID=2781 RepID=A0A1C9CEZ2_9FLOR|nr:acetyl-CoA carboxylase carboxyltransferase alpha subunit [Gracilariopsis lemaneiformis]YP_009294679.1 acetyl-CoA carboxylase carboxyltransferase alpha subunit [Gracilariopsis chorda]AJO68509.1 acetyl-CoA carboxylase carboxyltransferase alpha subunit [Gracilariopsis lemaneiformis]AML79770.1 acetyl-CoA carboxylase carboxyltransferase alpha subunit [Gracilariopsis lemaneiformis]AOM66939.1 acetyl-CoA carboxylase carboxyltransferase alpha subunit [Gracilariopsis chorda]
MTGRKGLSLDFLKPILELEYQIQQLSKISIRQQVSLNQEIVEFKEQITILKHDIFQSLTPLQRLYLVRQADRPTTLDYIPYLMDEWIELHGDRGGTDDPALVGGIGRVNNHTVIFIGHQRGKDTKDNVLRNFGMASPGGYRKALRLMQHANRFNFPILTFIDTPGAWAGIDAEKLGQGEAIAVNLREMFSFDVPIICTILGEGGSGGALGIGIGDKILMLEYAVYTVATPEACAAILWKDSKRSWEAAEALKITSADLKILGIIDEIIPEPLGASQANVSQAAYILKKSLVKQLTNLLNLSSYDRKELRYRKFRKIGTFYEG